MRGVTGHSGRHSGTNSAINELRLPPHVVASIRNDSDKTGESLFEYVKQPEEQQRETQIAQSKARGFGGSEPASISSPSISSPSSDALEKTMFQSMFNFKDCAVTINVNSKKEKDE